jgi:hypothetical protein
MLGSSRLIATRDRQLRDVLRIDNYIIFNRDGDATD